MKNLISILFCLLVLSTITTLAQYKKYQACISTDVNNTPNNPYTKYAEDNPYDALGNFVNIKAVANVSVWKYRGSGTLVAEIWTSFIEKPGSVQYGEVSARASRGSDQFNGSSASNSTNVIASFAEGYVKAYSTGSTEGSACAVLTLTWW